MEQKSQKGVTLIEVLVAALILAIGLVGLASLHLNSLKAAHSSYYRSIATMIAVDIEERAWLSLASNGQLLATDLPGIATATLNYWNNACPGACTLLPNLAIVLTPTARIESLDIDIQVSWSEARFVDINGESFGYRARIPTGG